MSKKREKSYLTIIWWIGLSVFCESQTFSGDLKGSWYWVDDRDTCMSKKASQNMHFGDYWQNQTKEK